MNLHGLVSGAIGAVNPFIVATLRQSAGTYTTAADGTRTPNYLPDQQAYVQVQSCSTSELQQLDSLNIQGISRAIYLQGAWNGVVRAAGDGGDLLLFNGRTWLVTLVSESWVDWARLVVTMQMDPVQ